MNPYYEDWAREIGILYNPTIHRRETQSETVAQKMLTPNTTRYAYMTVGAVTWTAAHYMIVSNLDGPLPFMDYVAIGTAAKAARFGAGIGGAIYDITHD